MPDFPGYAVKSGEDMPVLYHAAADACPQRYHKHAFGALARAVCISSEMLARWEIPTRKDNSPDGLLRDVKMLCPLRMGGCKYG